MDKSNKKQEKKEDSKKPSNNSNSNQQDSPSNRFRQKHSHKKPSNKSHSSHQQHSDDSDELPEMFNQQIPDELKADLLRMMMFNAMFGQSNSSSDDDSDDSNEDSDEEDQQTVESNKDGLPSLISNEENSKSKTIDDDNEPPELIFDESTTRDSTNEIDDLPDLIFDETTVKPKAPTYFPSPFGGSPPKSQSIPAPSSIKSSQSSNQQSKPSNQSEKSTTKPAPTKPITGFFASPFGGDPIPSKSQSTDQSQSIQSTQQSQSNSNQLKRPRPEESNSQQSNILGSSSEFNIPTTPTFPTSSPSSSSTVSSNLNQKFDKQKLLSQDEVVKSLNQVVSTINLNTKPPLVQNFGQPKPNLATKQSRSSYLPTSPKHSIETSPNSIPIPSNSSFTFPSTNSITNSTDDSSTTTSTVNPFTSPTQPTNSFANFTQSPIISSSNPSFGSLAFQSSPNSQQSSTFSPTNQFQFGQSNQIPNKSSSSTIPINIFGSPTSPNQNQSIVFGSGKPFTSPTKTSSFSFASPPSFSTPTQISSTEKSENVGIGTQTTNPPISLFSSFPVDPSKQYFTNISFSSTKKFTNLSSLSELNYIQKSDLISSIDIDLSENQLNEQNFNLIDSSLKENTKLVQLNLSKNQLNDKCALKLIDCLQNKNFLSQLNLENNQIERNGIQSICKVLKPLKSLSSINIGNNPNLRESFEDLLQLQLSKSNLKISTLDKVMDDLLTLNNNSSSKKGVQFSNLIERKDIDLIFTALKLNNRLESVTFGEMILNEEFLNDLSKVYHENTKLNELNFHFTNFSILQKQKFQSNDLQRFLESLKSLKTLRTIRLEDQQLNDKDALIIANFLLENDSLTRLSISNNLITDEGMITIANAIQKNSSLRFITISYNNITIDSLIPLFSCKNLTIETNNEDIKNLSIFKLDQNLGNAFNISKLLKNWKQIEIIPNILSTNTSVTTFQIDSDWITDESTELLINTLKSCPKIISFLISGTILSDLIGFAKKASNLIRILKCVKLSFNGTTSKISKYLRYLLKRPDCTELEIVKDFYYQKEELSSLFLNLIDNQFITSISIADIGIEKVHIEILGDALRSNTNLNNLSFTNENGLTHSINELANAIRNANSLKILYIHSSLFDNDTSKLLRLIGNQTSITELSLAENGLGLESAKALSEFIRLNSTLQTLNLCDNLLDSECIRVIGDSISNSFLNSIDLDDNIFDEDGYQIIANFNSNRLNRIKFEFNRSLQNTIISILNNEDISEIHFEHEEFDANDLRICLKVLRNYSSIRKICFESVGLDNDDLSLVIQLLSINTHIQAVNLCHNGIGNEYSQKIARLFHQKNSLEHIILHGNNIGDFGAIQIAKSFPFNQTLRTLDLSMNEFSERSRIEIERQLKSNVTLTELEVQNREEYNSDSLKSIKNMLTLNTKAKETIEQLRPIRAISTIQKAIYHVYYSPGGQGYLKARDNFNVLRSSLGDRSNSSESQ